MKPLTVLIVEDELVVALDLEARLTDLGYSVAACAGSGAQALAIAEQSNPDLVLMDIHLPGDLDGIATATTMRQRLGTVVIFLTAYGDPQTLRRAQEAEPYGFLLKPADDDDLRAALETAVARHQAELRIARSEARLQRAVKAGKVGLWEWDLANNSVHYSPEYKHQIGYEDNEIGDDINEWQTRVHPEDEQRLRTTIERFLKQPWPDYQVEFRFRHKNGSYRWILAQASLELNKKGRPVRMVGSHVDITAQKDREAEVERLRRLYLALSQVNQLITRVGTREQLFQGVCKLLVKFGQLRMAWIGWRDQQTQAIKPVAQFGDNGGYLSQITVTADESAYGHGPVGTAVREERSVIENDFLHSPSSQPWQAAAARQGYGAVAGFPIREDLKVRGVLAVYAAESGFFKEQEVLLFEEASVDVSFALGHIEQETHRQLIEKSLRQKTEELDRYFTSALDLLCIADVGGHFRRLNPEWERTLGYPLAELEGHGIFDFVHPDDVQQARSQWAQLTKDESFGGFINRCRHKNGEDRWIEWRGRIHGDLIYATARDVTDRYKAEQQLLHSHQLMQYIIAHARSAIAVHDRDLRYIYVSERYLRDYDIRDQSIIGKYHYEVVPDLPEKWRKVHQRALAGEVCTAEEDAFQRADGTTEWTRWECRPWYESDWRIGGIIVYTEIITERKRIEAALRASEKRFRAVVEAAPDAIFIQTGGRFIYVNPMAVRLFGADQTAELVGQPVLEYFHPNERDLIRERMRQLKEERRPTPLEEETIVTGRGEHIPVEVSAVPFEHEGEPGALVFLHDIRDRRHAEAQIRQLSQAVEQSPASIMITDATGAIEYVNSKFTRLTGYSLAEVMGKNPRILKGNDTPPAEYERLWRTITAGGEWEGELRNRKKNGDLHWEHVSISPIVNTSGQITHFLAVKEDITEHKALEEQLRQAQKLESVGQLAGGIAHDFNNILAAIMMHLSLMQQKDTLDLETKDSLKELMQEAHRAANLTRQLLAFSRRSVLEVRSVDMNQLVANLLKMLGRLIGEHIVVRFERKEGLPAVEADASMLEQVLMNLAVNARDAMPQGGLLTISLGVVHADEKRLQATREARPGTYVCLSVTDSGSGMDDATLKRIFEPFFTTKETGKGTGLGLATVHGIVAQHKGWIEVESEPGKGSTFRVFLPTAKSAGEALTAEKNADARRGQETILLVEDDSTVRRVVGQSLRALGYAVLEAADGKQAQELWREHQKSVQLLFTDMVMPEGITGLELANKLRHDRPDLRVVISSGYNTDNLTPDKLAAQEILYLQKPFELTRMAQAIRECMEGSFLDAER